MVNRALRVIMLAIKAPTVTYGVRGAKSITENAAANRMAFLIIPLPGLAAVHSKESVMSWELGVGSFSDP